MNQTMSQIEHINQKLGTVFDMPQATVLAEVITGSYEDLVKTDDFRELKAIVARIADMQDRSERRMARSEQRLDRIDQRLERITESQQQTEQQIKNLTLSQQQTEQRMEDLTQTQQELTLSMQAASQRLDRVEDRFDRMVVVQDETNQRLSHLEDRFDRMVVTQDEMNKKLGSLDRRFGFDFEEFISAILPPHLEKYNQVTDVVFEREFITLPDGHEEEIDLTGWGEQDDKPIRVLVECRASLRRGEAIKLTQKFKDIETAEGAENSLLAIVAMNMHPSAVEVGESAGIEMIPYSWLNRPRDFEKKIRAGKNMA